MITDSYQNKLDSAAKQVKAHINGIECERFIIEWVVRHGLSPRDLETPEDRIRDQESWKNIQKKLRAPIIKPRSNGKWAEKTEIIARFNQAWGDEAIWKQKLLRCGIPYVDRSDAPADLWEQIDPVGKVSYLRSWIDSKPGESTLEIYGRILLSLTLYKLAQLAKNECLKPEANERKDPDAMEEEGPEATWENPVSTPLPSNDQKERKGHPGRSKEWNDYPDFIKAVVDHYNRTKSQRKTAGDFQDPRPENHGKFLTREMVRHIIKNFG